MSQNTDLLTLAHNAGFSLELNNSTGEQVIVTSEEEFVLDQKLEHLYKAIYNTALNTFSYQIRYHLLHRPDKDINKAVENISKIEKSLRV